MSKLLRRQLLALMLGVTGLTLAMPLTHNAAAFAEDGGSDDGGSGSDHHSASGGGNGSDDDGGLDDSGISGDDDDSGAVGGAPKGKFQEGCAITDVQCLNGLVK
jgi:hypothetical protein